MRLADAQAVKAAVAAGVNVFASSGDNGAFSCSRFDLKDWRPTGGNPSDFPFTISVGGTFLERGPDGEYVDEAAWEWPLLNAGTGGGLNPLDDRPDWQEGPGVDNTSSNGKRQYPDVSAPADPYTGWYIVVGGEGSSAGGTSASSPFWAGLTALYEQMATKAGLDGLGFLTPTLYAVAASSPTNTLFHDIVRGGNLFYETTPGWDYATGSRHADRDEARRRDRLVPAAQPALRVSASGMATTADYRPSGHSGTRLNRWMIVLSAVIGLVVVIGAASALLAINEPGPAQPDCKPDQPCLPPSPNDAVTLGHLWVSRDLAYSFQYPTDWLTRRL